MAIQTVNGHFPADSAKGAAHHDGFWTTLVNGFRAISEGITLAGEYKELTNRGVPSDVAARKVFEKIGTR